MSGTPHPCLSCGACCARERVQLHRDHVRPHGPVPAELVVVATTPDHVWMRGTVSAPRRCVALVGEVGDAVKCRIYADRPPPCRDFRASGDDGVGSAECDAARARHGLAPLKVG